MAKVRLDHILAPLGIGKMTSDEELEELCRQLQKADNIKITAKNKKKIAYCYDSN